MSKKAAVAIDIWKLEIFRKHLNGAGYKFTEHPGVTKESMLLQVEYEWVANLKPVIEAAQLECAKMKPGG